MLQQFHTARRKRQRHISLFTRDGIPRGCDFPFDEPRVPVIKGVHLIVLVFLVEMTDLRNPPKISTCATFQWVCEKEGGWRGREAF